MARAHWISGAPIGRLAQGEGAWGSGTIWEASGRHLWEAPGRHLGSGNIWEASGKHQGSICEASRTHLWRNSLKRYWDVVKNDWQDKQRQQINQLLHLRWNIFWYEWIGPNRVRGWWAPAPHTPSSFCWPSGLPNRKKLPKTVKNRSRKKLTEQRSDFCLKNLIWNEDDCNILK